MRINLTKKDIVNSIYMQIGFSKKISETLLEDLLDSSLKRVSKIPELKTKFSIFKDYLPQAIKFVKNSIKQYCLVLIHF